MKVQIFHPKERDHDLSPWECETVPSNSHLKSALGANVLAHICNIRLKQARKTETETDRDEKGGRKRKKEKGKQKEKERKEEREGRREREINCGKGLCKSTLK